MKLKDLIIANFIPEEIAKGIEKRAAWIENEDGDGWIIPVSSCCRHNTATTVSLYS